jgi:hypothetical protein
MKKLTGYLVGLSVAGALLGNPVKSLANVDSADATIGIWDQSTMAATDFCYAGSIMDPATGEEFDLYNLCIDNLDLA